MTRDRSERSWWGRSAVGYVVIVGVTAVATVGVILLLQNISARKEEGRTHYFPVVPVDETTVDPEEWAPNFPYQYDTYSRPADNLRTRWGGSEAFQKLREFPIWTALFAGYGFGIDYREERGHAYMLSDQRETKRVTEIQQPGACLHCHASTPIVYRRLGLEAGEPGQLTDGFDTETARAQLMRGFEIGCAMPYDSLTLRAEHPVSCGDCHDPKTMRLRVTRPGFLNGIQRLAESDDPLPQFPSIGRWREGDREDGYDANALASRQEMRTFVCGQCHVEYYFEGEGKLLTYPWHNGLRAEQMEAYYDDVAFADWTHAESGARMLKAQHPEFEMWTQGTHSRAGVACADCHMPYERIGAVKVSNHHVRSPLLSIGAACQTCHRTSEEELFDRATAIQDKTQALQEQAERAVFELMRDIAAARAAGASDPQLSGPRARHRQAQWRLDFIAAENSRGFHADQETARLLANAMELARRGQIEIARMGLDLPPEGERYTLPEPLPDEPLAAEPGG
ncbi:MAG: ammonia-forming cytochrome c nitrite reductase subunit c552 [Candidatus Eisenbacteria bacterium]|nr:ammonia-forming cytochrome c nitrite reductase subunit c552 [Candidatus Latescibacterota bacterium]MBD3302036.1 ammonia-forming cytochrome c nitrite reductase subunit c552 [Candidatus Eisenbacteria bacterium]